LDARNHLAGELLLDGWDDVLGGVLEELATELATALEHLGQQVASTAQRTSTLAPGCATTTQELAEEIEGRITKTLDILWDG
jgi:hypothetical protein